MTGGGQFSCRQGVRFGCRLTYLRFPIAHRRVTRTTKLLEPLFGDERRRMKIVANTFGERAVRKRMCAALIRASESWRGIQLKSFEAKQLEAVGAALASEHERRYEPTMRSEPVSPAGGSGRDRTGPTATLRPSLYSMPDSMLSSTRLT